MLPAYLVKRAELLLLANMHTYMCKRKRTCQIQHIGTAAFNNTNHLPYNF